jgi:hypothetical protein
MSEAVIVASVRSLVEDIKEVVLPQQDRMHMVSR